MKVILHIGTEKTGTSSIQELLLQNKSRLADKGYLYLHMQGRNEYRDFSAYCMSKDRVDGYFRVNGVTNKQRRDDFDRNFISVFKQSIASIGENIHTVIISSEHFSSRLSSVEEIRRVRGVLEDDFDSIQIICYLRSQVDKVCSGYSTRIKSGGRMSFDVFFKSYLDKYGDKYDRNLAVWEEVFGFDNMSVRVFDRDFFSGGSLISDFFSLFDGDLLQSINTSFGQQNESLSQRGCEILRWINYLFPGRIRGYLHVEELRVSIISILSRKAKGAPVRLTPEQAELVYDKFEASNARACVRYFPGRASLFKNKSRAC